MINKDGLLTIETIGSAKVEIDLIPKSNTKARPAYPMDFDYITVHETANPRVGADAKMHTEYVDETVQYVSWHFTVDGKMIFQELPIIENSWNAGDGRNGDGNRKSVSLELCVHKDGDWNTTKYNATKLIVALLLHGGKTPDVVKPHKFWSGKDCPHNILKEGWAGYMSLIEKEYEAAVQHRNQVSGWALKSWDKAFVAGINDGRDPKATVTEEQLMVFFDRLKLLD